MNVGGRCVPLEPRQDLFCVSGVGMSSTVVLISGLIDRLSTEFGCIRRNKRARATVFLVLLCAMAFGHVRVNAADELPVTIEFNRDIRPILSDNCFFCHGPDNNKREAGLRLDTQEGLLGGDSGGAIVPRDPENSPLYRRIVASDPDEIMPPPHSGKSLTERDRLLIRSWIQQGGHYQGHWAFLPISLHPDAGRVPSGSDESAVASVIDQMVTKQLESHSMNPSPEADRVTLIRRLSFDLIGLPPTEEEVDHFVADTSPDAYEKVVDRLLASPHFGERFAIWWLDLVRYADTVGYHGDQQVSVSPFRQYVIESFNAGKPFDQFTIEQLAGDLLPDASLEQRIASGYNRLGMMSAEGGVQDKEYLAKYIAERVRNVSGTWLGITMGCCECHDHKFDPLTTKEFYQFEAFFADIRERGLYSGANSDGNWGPYVKVPTAEQSAELAELDTRTAELRSVLEKETPELQAAQNEWEKTQVRWTALTPDEMTSLEGARLTRRADGAVLATEKNPATDTYVLKFSDVPAGFTALRLEVLPDDTLPRKGPGRAGNGNFVLSELTVEIHAPDAEPAEIPLQNPTATYEQTGAADGNPYGKWAIAATVDKDVHGAKWGWAVMEKVGQPHVAVFETTADQTLPEGSTLVIRMAQNLDNPGHNIGCFRWSVTKAPRPLDAAAAPPVSVTEAMAVAETDRTDAQRAEIASYYRSIAPLLVPARAVLAALEKKRATLDAEIVTTLVTEAVQPRPIRVLPRGNWMDDTGEPVTPAFPAALMPQHRDVNEFSGKATDDSAAQPAPDRPLNRLDLAKWIVSPENPLTARVVVNRLWKLCFGAGLSRRVDDLGAQGEWPTHPELLDFLADDFRTHGWNLKRTIRAMVLSRTYRQDSRADEGLRELDPDNRRLARQSRFRLDAELVRDNSLAVSGLLVKTIGGRSVFPYQPPGYWAYLNFPTREWQNSKGDELYRRGVYTHWQRQYLHPALLAFDAPGREECTAERPRSSTPLQALVLLNDPSFVEAARVFAEQLIRQSSSDRERIDIAFRRALSRSATDDESHVLLQLLAQHLADYQAAPEQAGQILAVGERRVPADLNAAELAAWTSVTRTILNLHEFNTRF